jgi:peptidyl-prolyl cis-trans isomerase D
VQHLAGTEGKVTDAMIKDYYEKNLDRFSIPETRDAEHLTVLFGGDYTLNDKIHARKILENMRIELKSGVTMQELQKKYSGSGLNISVNSLSGITRDKPVPKLDKELFNLEENDISPIMEDESGLHVFKCIGIKPPHIRSYESSVYEIRERLHYIIFGHEEKKIMQNLKKKADIKILAY